MKSLELLTAKLIDDFFGDYPNGRMFATLPIYRAGDIVLVLGKTPSRHIVVESIVPTSPEDFIRPILIPERFLSLTSTFPKDWKSNDEATELEPSIGYPEIIAKHALERINDWDDFPEESKKHEGIIGTLVRRLRDELRQSNSPIWDEHSYLNSRKYTVHRFGRQFLCFKRNDYESIDHLDENVSNYYFDCRSMKPASEIVQQLKFFLGDSNAKSEHSDILPKMFPGATGNELIMKQDGKAMISNWVYFYLDHFDSLYAESKNREEDIDTLLNQIVIVAHEWPGKNDFMRTTFAEPKFRLVCYYKDANSVPVNSIKRLVPKDELSIAGAA